MDKKARIEGLIAPVFTPLAKNGDVDVGAIPDYARFLKSRGLKGAFILGSSGEGLLLTTDERKKVAKAWEPYADSDFKLIMHVGSTSYRQSQELAEHAMNCGAWAISSMGPLFSKPESVNELLEFCRLIAGSAPSLPFYYYHIPVRSGISVSMAEFLSEGSKVIPNLAGIKYTHSNFNELQQCINLNNNQFDIAYGQEDSLLCGLVVGVKGSIGTTYNFIPGIYYNIMDLYNEGKMNSARELQLKSVEIMNILKRYQGGIVAGKATMKMIGIDCGPGRSPHRSLSKKESMSLRQELEEISFFNFL